MTTDLLPLLDRIASALERLSPPAPTLDGLRTADAFIWQPERGRLAPVAAVAHVQLDLLQGVDSQKQTLLQNTRHFADGWPANNAMLWGSRGTGKSSLVKACHAAINRDRPAEEHLILVEIEREDLGTLPDLMALLRESSRRFIIFCDDLSFEKEDRDYKALKSVLDGGIAGRPSNVLFYATSNRRHLMPRDMIDNERSTAINPSEATEEKVSLSDRFGLWLGFHVCPQDVYLDMVRAYAKELNLPISDEELCAQASEWSVTRGNRSGRVAAQFIDDLTAVLRDRATKS
ncbi:ATP-binding protein [Acetobacter sp.]|uniref:ATP-binding protein n=1 Tax=Acetobacter sp. TaxID=440 RepID=UPI0039EAAC6D